MAVGKLGKRSVEYESPVGAIRISVRGELTPERVEALAPLGALAAALLKVIKSRLIRQRKGPNGEQMGPYFITGGMWAGARVAISAKNEAIVGFWGKSEPANWGRAYNPVYTDAYFNKHHIPQTPVKNAIKAAQQQKYAPAPILEPTEDEVRQLLEVLAETYTRAAMQGATYRRAAGKRQGFFAKLAQEIRP